MGRCGSRSVVLAETGVGLFGCVWACVRLSLCVVGPWPPLCVCVCVPGSLPCLLTVGSYRGTGTGTGKPGEPGHPRTNIPAPVIRILVPGRRPQTRYTRPESTTPA